MSIADAEMSSIVLNNCVRSSTYAAKVVPFLEPNLFVNMTERAIATVIIDFFEQYKRAPNVEQVVVGLKDLSYVNNLDRNVTADTLGNSGYNATDFKWLLDSTERFIRRRRTSLAFERTYDDFEKGEDIGYAPDLMRDAQSFSFSLDLGYDFVASAGERYDIYTEVASKMSFYLEMLDKVTGGGAEKGTLNVFLAGTGVGKSLSMCSLACNAALNGKMVLYISMEMGVYKLSERVEANMMNVPITQMKKLSRPEFNVRQEHYIKKLKENGGNIIFKQYPTGTAHAGHVRNLLVAYQNQGIEFDAIYLDYINICDSMFAKKGDNSYTRIKAIAEEFRALAVEFDLPIISATQTNRDGQDSTAMTLKDVSESHGLSATVDMLFGLMITPDWRKQKRLKVQQLKNRYGDIGWFNEFWLGVEYSMMRLFDLDMSCQDDGMSDSFIGGAEALEKFNTCAVDGGEPVDSPKVEDFVAVKEENPFGFDE